MQCESSSKHYGGVRKFLQTFGQQQQVYAILDKFSFLMATVVIVVDVQIDFSYCTQYYLTYFICNFKYHGYFIPLIMQILN